MSPLLWISLGVAALLLTALWFVRRRRQEQQEPDGITGRWEQLESEVDDDQVREATERMRRQLPEQTIVVEEQRAERPQRAEPEEERRPAAKPARARVAAAAAPPVEETLSNQTVINLDQADAVAEADFHMAYGLYDQAAELVQKALEASPNRRDLKLKLLEVFFVWGNKDSFLKAAQNLRSEIGQGADADWDKVVIMGRQICPGEKLFTRHDGCGRSRRRGSRGRRFAARSRVRRCARDRYGLRDGRCRCGARLQSRKLRRAARAEVGACQTRCQADTRA